jgi:hypothetical protein
MLEHPMARMHCEPFRPSQKTNQFTMQHLIVSAVLALFLRLVAAQSSNDPCQQQCSGLNASVAACSQYLGAGGYSGPFMTCVCGNLQFNSDAQTCYDCYQANGDTQLLSEVSSFLNLCHNGNATGVSVPGVSVSASVSTGTVGGVDVSVTISGGGVVPTTGTFSTVTTPAETQTTTCQCPCASPEE